MKSKIIVFDMDGVLFDTTEIARKNMKNRFPDITDEIQKEILTGNFHEEVAKLTIPRKKETEEEKITRQLQYSKDKSKALMYMGMKELLIEIKERGHIIIMNTSALDRNCIPLLEKSDIKDLFDMLATAELSKSKVEKFKMIQEKYGIEKNEMLFITDTLGDIKEADIAGIQTVAVTWGAHDKSYFTREKHENLIKVLDSVSELQDFILKQESSNVTS